MPSSGIKTPYSDSSRSHETKAYHRSLLAAAGSATGRRSTRPSLEIGCRGAQVHPDDLHVLDLDENPGVYNLPELALSLMLDSRTSLRLDRSPTRYATVALGVHGSAATPTSPYA
jgi:hypothetical protein